MSDFRVVHVVCTNAFAGVERYVRDAAIAHARRGAKVHVIGGDSSMRTALAPAGVSWSPGATVPRAIRALRALPTPDVIVTHMTAADVAASLANLGNRVPIVSVRHFAAPRGSHPLATPLIRAAERHNVSEIAVSNAVAAHCAPGVRVIRTGTSMIDDDGTEREPFVLVAQRLEAEKSTDDALQAWALAAPLGWRMVVAGDGARLEHLRELAKQLGVEQTVDFVGFRSDLSALMRRASILIAPTANEGLGLSVVEAMAHGLPVIATASGGHLETAGAVTDPYLYAPHDVEAAARTIAILADNPELCRSYGERLRTHQRLSLDADTQWHQTSIAIEEVGAGALA
jgi:glycosyltransferase involved in cell wall biosynthesis